MKVLLFMDVFIFGGVEKMLKELSDYLVNYKGYTVDLLLLYKAESNSYLDMLNSKVQVKYIWDIDKAPNILKRAVFWLNVIVPRFVSRRIDTSIYDWVITFKDDYQCNLISSCFSCKKIAWVHNITEDYQKIQRSGIKYRLADFVYQSIYKKYLKSFSLFDKIICVSEHAKKALECRCPDKIKSIVIYNYVDELQIKKQSMSYFVKPLPYECVFCYIGRLSAEKGVENIIKAVCDLREEKYNVGLVIVGEGYQLNELKRYACERSCDQYIHFLGTKKNPYPIILQSDAVICASQKESFGLVVLEGILLNKWVISTKCGGPEEIIDSGVNGIIVSDYTNLVEAMKDYFQNRYIPMKSNKIDYFNLKEQYFLKLHKILEGEKNEDSIIC